MEGKIENIIPKVEIEQKTKLEQIRDEIFDSILFENVLSSYEEDLEKSGYSKEQIVLFFSILNNLDQEDQKKVLSFAYEQRQLLFKNYLRQIQEGAIAMSDFINEILEIAKEYGYSIGFHVTKNKIKKSQNKDGRETWDIKGIEKDHRDGDLPMAFYSKQYRHLYGRKGYHYIYTVRSLPEHRTDGNWFRAPMLSIVSELQVEPEMLVDKIHSELENRRREAQK
jgi:hypothetical protein